MMNQNEKNFAWLNREGTWQGSLREGLSIGSSGELQLSAVPLLEGVAPADLATLPAPDGPAGIAVDRDGTIYFSEPARNRIWRIDGCDKSTAPVPCLGATRGPRGLLMRPKRAALSIAESRGHEVRAVQIATAQSLEVWPGLDTPWTLTASGTATYVVDYGSRSLQKFNSLGELQPSFWDNLRSTQYLQLPVEATAGEDQIYIADQALHAIVVADSEGRVKRTPFGGDQLQQPLGMALAGDVLYVGDNGRRRVFAFAASSGRFIGEAVGYQGPVAALALDGAGGLLVHSGSALPPVRLLLDLGFVKQGTLSTSAIQAPTGKVLWHRLKAVLAGYSDDLPSETHMQIFIHTSNDVTDAPVAPVLDPGGANPFTDSKWTAHPADVTDLFIGGCAALYMWIGVWVTGNGLASPVIEQMRIEFDHKTYLSNLPALYQKPGVCHDFLLRLLSLFESFNAETESAIGRLPGLFDPKSAPSAYLPWLAGWLGLQLEEDWDETTVREAIADAFARYAQRGTAVGLKNVLKGEAGVDVMVQEPMLNAAWWSLPVPEKSGCGENHGAAETVWQASGNSILGYSTVLAPAQAQGAVLGTSAILDQSHLITEDDFGLPLFEGLAFQFNVQAYRGQVNSPSAIDALRALIDREKPAHTSYHLCLLEPKMRVGFQARVGMDAIVSGSPPSIRLGESPYLGIETALGGQPAGRIGARLQVGFTSLVG